MNGAINQIFKPTKTYYTQNLQNFGKTCNDIWKWKLGNRKADASRQLKSEIKFMRTTGYTLLDHKQRRPFQKIKNSAGHQSIQNYWTSVFGNKKRNVKQEYQKRL